MQINHRLHDRRRFLRLAVGFSTGALLSGCADDADGDRDTGGEAVAAVITPVASVSVQTPVRVTGHPLNLALTLAYLGAQYHSVGARGRGLATTLTGGVGRAGAVAGGRRVAFADPLIAELADELADDKTAQVVALRATLGAAAAAQPALDLSSTPTSAFSLAAQRAGVVADGERFDPYADDSAFLLGALLIENGVAATYRTLLTTGADAASKAAATTQLADAIYHGGLIRALLDDRAARDPAVADSFTRLSATLAATDVASADLLDAAGRAIPFTREPKQVLGALYLSDRGAGGFLPIGVDGIG